MKNEDVPQDRGIYGDWSGINYSIDDNGRYSLSPSKGWEPVNAANRQAWEVAEQEIDEITGKVLNGVLSPIAYHMAHSLMDVKLLARYTGLSQWRVKRHMNPRVFGRLKPDVLSRYARVFKMKIEELKEIPK